MKTLWREGWFYREAPLPLPAPGQQEKRRRDVSRPEVFLPTAKRVSTRAAFDPAPKMPRFVGTMCGNALLPTVPCVGRSVRFAMGFANDLFSPTSVAKIKNRQRLREMQQRRPNVELRCMVSCCLLAQSTLS